MSGSISSQLNTYSPGQRTGRSQITNDYLTGVRNDGIAEADTNRSQRPMKQTLTRGLLAEGEQQSSSSQFPY